METIEYQDVASQLDVSTSATDLPTKNVSLESRLSNETLEIIAVSTQKAISFEGVARCLWSIGEMARHPSVSKLLSFELASSFGELPKLQDDLLKEIGFLRQTDGSYKTILPTLNIEILISFKRQRLQQGSLYRKTKTKVVVTSPDGKDIMKMVVAALIGSALTSSANIPDRDFAYGPKSRPIYICTINNPVMGDSEYLISEAAAMLSTNTFTSKSHEREVWKARQMCLAAAGFSPGEIDGVPGERTNDAVKRYSAEFDNVQVFWSSPIFARHLI